MCRSLIGIRGALAWLGCADPADTSSSILDSDPEKEELIDVINLWRAAYGYGNAISVVKIDARADAPVEEHERFPAAEMALGDKLVEVACKGQWSAKSVGWWLRRHKDRVIAKIE